MIWIVIILIILIIILIKFNLAIVKDNKELNNEPLEYKFNRIYEYLIDRVYGGNGKINVIDNRALNLYSDGALQIVQVFYSTGHLTLTWRKRTSYKNEIVFEKQYNNVRNINIVQQEEIALNFLLEADKYFNTI